MKIFVIFLIFAQNIDCGYMYNLCFGAKIRKMCIHGNVVLMNRRVQRNGGRVPAIQETRIPYSRGLHTVSPRCGRA